jgi:hypothetical protein
MYLRLLYAYILQSRLNLKWKAIYELEVVLSSQSTFCLHINACNYLLAIEKDIEDRDAQSEGSVTIDIKAVLTSQQLHTDLKSLLLNTVAIYLSYWKEIKKEKPRGTFLQLQGFQLLEYHDKIDMLREKITAVNPSNLRTLILYGNFANLVENNQEKTDKIQTRIDTIKSSLANKFLVNVNSLNFYDNINPCIIVASGDSRTIGIMKAYNPEVLKTLELSREQVAGQNVSCLMPKILSEWHDR